MWFERWFLSSNAKDIGVLYLIYALFAGLIGTAFSVLIRLELSGPGVQYIADNQLYNSIITAHAIIMIFFMVKKYYVLNSNFTLFKQVNSDNKSPFLSESDNNDSYNTDNENNTSHNDRQNDNNKHNYVKVFVDDPYNNREIILEVTKKQKGVYIWQSLDGKDMYVGHSINLYNRISSYNYHTLTTSSVLSSKLAMRDSSGLLPLNPWFLTGFFDGESSFYITMHKSNNVKTGWSVRAIFETHLHVKDKALLENIQFSLGGVGSITTRDRQVSFKVYYRDLAVLIDHFDNYPLITKKRADFELFKRVLGLMDRQEHLTPEGLIKIARIKASMNKGLSEDLQTAFPNVTPVSRPIVDVAIIPDPNWIAGFVSGEGCFSVNIAKSSSCKTGSRVWLSFKITQHTRDAVLMKVLTEYLGCGHYYLNTKQDVGDIIVSGLSDLTTKIIPLFEKYPIIGVKALDYADFCKALKLIKDKAHLTELGLDNIRLIKAGMNRGRKS